VCGVLSSLKMSSGGKPSPAKELTTGSIQRSPAIRQSDPMAAFLVAPAVAPSIQRPIKSTAIEPVPLPRPRPKRL
jgi:hypothetical protein